MLQPRKIQNFDSKISDGVDQAAYLTLKQKSIANLNIPQTISRGMDELQTHTNPTF